MHYESRSLLLRLSPRRNPFIRAGAVLTMVAFVAATTVGMTVRPVDGKAVTGSPGETKAVPETIAVAPPRLDPVSVSAAEGALREALDDRAFPGAAMAVGIRGRAEREVGVGNVRWSDQAPEVSARETVYDLASLTKLVATTTAVMLLVEDGRIALDDPVQRSLPEYEGVGKERVTWRHLLTHTAGLPAGANIRGSTDRERLRRLLRTRLTQSPGQGVTYTDLGFLVLWAAAERVAGEPLPQLLERRVWRPLGMNDTGFLPGQECEACAPTLLLSTGEPYRGRPNDLYARRVGGIAGNAGLFSTAHDLGRYAAMLAGGGELDGVRVLRPETVREMLRQQPGTGRRTLGAKAFCPGEPARAELACEAPVAYGHTGWTGTSLWVDPESGVWTVLLTNRTYNVRTPADISGLRWEIFRAAAGLPERQVTAEEGG